MARSRTSAAFSNLLSGGFMMTWNRVSQSGRSSRLKPLWRSRNALRGKRSLLASRSGLSLSGRSLISLESYVSLSSPSLLTSRLWAFSVKS